MPTLTPSPRQEEALAYARENDVLVVWSRGQGKTTFLAMFADQCLRQSDSACVFVYVAPTRRQCQQLHDAVSELVLTSAPKVADLQTFLISLPGDVYRLAGLHLVNIIVLMDECQDISRLVRSRLQEQLTAIMCDTPVRIAQTALINVIGPAVF